MKRVHLWISGNVEGVGFMTSLKRRSKNKNVTGWAQNLEDGRVETVLEGEENDLAEVMEWCRKGPSIANVENIKLEEEELEFVETFEIKR